MAKYRVADVNDFFNLTGGGVRRYHLEKLRYLAKREDLEYHLLLPSDRNGIEVFGHARIHHVKATPLGSGYRMMLNPLRLRRVLHTIRPDVIEVGSPYNTPDWVRFAVWGLDCQLVGFWHANFPVTDVGRVLSKQSKWLGELGEKLAWAWARRTYGKFAATMAATDCMVQQLHQHGIDDVVQTPLGVDTQMFHPKHRDHALRAKWGAGPDDVVMAWAGRLSDDKNYKPLLEAWQLVAERTGREPFLVVAGHGPGEAMVRALAGRSPRVHYLGFIEQSREMARILASSDVVAALCPYETFGLAAVEAMSSGAAILGSAHMSIGEILATCRCGIAVETADPTVVADAWIELLRPGRAALLGARGHQESKARYSWRQTFTRIVQVYEQVLAQAAGSRRLIPGPMLAPLLQEETGRDLLWTPATREGESEKTAENATRWRGL